MKYILVTCLVVGQICPLLAQLDKNVSNLTKTLKGLTTKLAPSTGGGGGGTGGGGGGTGGGGGGGTSTLKPISKTEAFEKVKEKTFSNVNSIVFFFKAQGFKLDQKDAEEIFKKLGGSKGTGTGSGKGSITGYETITLDAAKKALEGKKFPNGMALKKFLKDEVEPKGKMKKIVGFTSTLEELAFSQEYIDV